MDERTVLRKAKEVLLERGWYQGGYCSDPSGKTGSVCTRGAVSAVLSGSPLRDEPSPAIRVLYHCGFGTAWNDAPERTLTDVFDLLDRAIASLDHETEPQKVVA